MQLKKKKELSEKDDWKNEEGKNIKTKFSFSNFSLTHFPTSSACRGNKP